MPSPATLLRLDQHAGGVDAQVGLLEGVGSHRGDKRLDQGQELVMPSAQRRARNLQAFARVDVLEAVGRKVVLPATHDRVREHLGPRQAALDGKARRRRNEHLSRLTVAVLAHKLRLDDAHHHERGRAALDDLGHLFADPLEGIESLTLHLLGQDLDVHSGKLGRDGLAAGGLAPAMRVHLFGAHLIDAGLLSLRKNGFEHRQRQLVLVRRKPLGLVPQQAPLELAAALHHLEVQLPVAVPLLLERIESSCKRLDLDHDSVGDRDAIDRQDRIDIRGAFSTPRSTQDWMKWAEGLQLRRRWAC
jgi:hypothetical protein